MAIKFKNALLQVCRDMMVGGFHMCMISLWQNQSTTMLYYVATPTYKQIPVAQKKDAGCSKKLILGRPREDHRLDVVSVLEVNDDDHITINDLLGLIEQKLINTHH